MAGKVYDEQGLWVTLHRASVLMRLPYETLRRWVLRGDFPATWDGKRWLVDLRWVIVRGVAEAVWRAKGANPDIPITYWVTAHQASVHMGIPYATLWRRIMQGFVRAQRVGRVWRVYLWDVVNCAIVLWQREAARVGKRKGVVGGSER